MPVETHHSSDPVPAVCTTSCRHVLCCCRRPCPTLQVPQLIAQNYLQLQQDVKDALEGSKLLKARQQLAKAIALGKEVGRQRAEADASSGDGSNSNDAAASSPDDARGGGSDVAAAEVAQQPGSSGGAAVRSSSPGTLEVDLQKLIAQAQAGQLGGTDDGQGGTTVVINAVDTTPQPGGELARAPAPEPPPLRSRG